MACSVDRSALGRRPARGLRLRRAAEPALAAGRVDDGRTVVALVGLVEDAPALGVDVALDRAAARLRRRWRRCPPDLGAPVGAIGRWRLERPGPQAALG